MIHTSLNSILTLSSHLPLGLPKGLFPAGLPVNILKALLPSSILATGPAHLSLLDLINYANDTDHEVPSPLPIRISIKSTLSGECLRRPLLKFSVTPDSQDQTADDVSVI